MTLPSITTRGDTVEETAAAERLAQLLGRFDLARFTYTDKILVDATATHSHSHPVLTLTPGHVIGPADDVVLTTYLHEQMHWAANTLAGFGPAIEEVTARWPDPPAHKDGGAFDAHSTWLHFPVCALELSAMSDVVGEERALATIAAVRWYRWIYERLLGHDLPWRAFLERHELVLPELPPTHATDVAWALGADAEELRAAIGGLADVLTDARLEPDFVVRIIALCCVTLDGRTPEAAAAIDPRNAELYPSLAARREEVDRATFLLRELRDEGQKT